MADQSLGSSEALPWLSLNEAARQLGTSVDALRSKARRGQLNTRKGNDGRLLVQVPPDLRLSGDEAMDNPQLGTADLVQEIGELRERLARAETERDAAKAVAAAEIRAAGERAVALRELVEELKAQLAEARKPWWRKWLT